MRKKPEAQIVFEEYCAENNIEPGSERYNYLEAHAMMEWMKHANPFERVVKTIADECKKKSEAMTEEERDELIFGSKKQVELPLEIKKPSKQQRVSKLVEPKRRSSRKTAR